MPTRWATANIVGHLSGLGSSYFTLCAVDLPDGGGLAVPDNVDDPIHLYTPLDAHVRGTPAATPYRSIGQAAGLGLATDGTHLYVAGCGHERLLQMRVSDGAVVDSIGKNGSGDWELRNPYGLALVLGSGHGGPSIELPSGTALATASGDWLYVADMRVDPRVPPHMYRWSLTTALPHFHWPTWLGAARVHLPVWPRSACWLPVRRGH